MNHNRCILFIFSGSADEPERIMRLHSGINTAAILDDTMMNSAAILDNRMMDFPIKRINMHKCDIILGNKP